MHTCVRHSHSYTFNSPGRTAKTHTAQKRKIKKQAVHLSLQANHQMLVSPVMKRTPEVQLQGFTLEIKYKKINNKDQNPLCP